MDAALDLFEDIKNAVGCEYISDLRLREYKCKKALKKADLSEYPTNQLIDMVEYIYRKIVLSREEAIAVLKG